MPPRAAARTSSSGAPAADARRRSAADPAPAQPVDLGSLGRPERHRPGQDEVEEPEQRELLRRRLEPLDGHRPCPTRRGPPRRSSSSPMTRSAASAERAFSAWARPRTARRGSAGARGSPTLEQRAGQLGRGADLPSTMQADRQPQPEQPEPVRAAPRGSPRRAGSGPGSRNRSTERRRSVRRASGSAATSRNQPNCSWRSVAPVSAIRPATGTTPEASSRTRRIGGVARGDRPRRVQRVRPGRADLVGSRQDDDRVDRRGVRRPSDPGRPRGTSTSRTVQVAHQVQHRVGLAGPVGLLVEQRGRRPRRVALVGRAEAGRVDERQLGAACCDGQPTSIRSIDSSGELAELDLRARRPRAGTAARGSPDGRRSATTR